MIGFANFARTSDDDLPASAGEVTGIYVAPEAWGRGGGLLLMDGARANLRAAGFATAGPWVIEDNLRARRFYERLGWTADGARRVDDRGDFVLLEVRYTTALESPG